MSRPSPLLLSTSLALPGAAAALHHAVCFTRSGASALFCDRQPVNGPITLQHEGATAPAVFRSGAVCEDARCTRCLLDGSGAWGQCGGWFGAATATLEIRASRANADLSPPLALAFVVVLLALPAGVFLMGSRAAPPPSGRAEPSRPALARLLSWLMRFASRPWFPFVAGLGTAINIFTLVFTGVTTSLFLAAVLGNPRAWLRAAVVNAAGATLGTAALLLLVRDRGVEWMSQSFPTLQTSPAWAHATSLMDSYGLLGMLLVCSLPIMLHPVIAFGMLAQLNNRTILLLVFLGRTAKYGVKGYLASNAPSLLRFFGVRAAVLEQVEKAKWE